MTSDNLTKTLDTWIDALSQYDFQQLCAKPSPASWSIGQVYMHLIENTVYFIEQAKICASSNDNITGEPSGAAKAMFANNSFPDEILEGPPENAATPQPLSKAQLIVELNRIKSESEEISVLITASQFKGKTKHPGLNYFSANEWLQFAEMHLRHHLRQKARIDAFLMRR